MPHQTAHALNQAAQSLAGGDITAAERIAESVLAKGADADALHLMGVVRVQQRRFDEALKLFAGSLVARPRQPQVLLNLGKTLALMGQPEHAAAALGDAVRFQPDLGEAWYELGNQQRLLGRLAEAEASYRRLLALAPGHGAGILALGAVLVDAGRAAEAEAVLAPGLAGTGDVSLAGELAYKLAFAQRAQGKREAALESLAQIHRLDPGRTDLDLTRASILEEMSRFDEALTVMEKVLAREPLNLAAHNNYNDLLYRLGRDEELLGSYDRAPKTAPLQLGKAGFLLAAKRAGEAHAVFADLLAREPCNAEAASGAATALSQMERHGEAVALLERAAAAQPGNPNLHVSLANALLLDRDPEKAAAMAQKGLAIAPYDQFGIAMLGTAWRLMGDEREEALNGYETLIRAYDLDPPEGFSDMAAFNAELVAELERMHPQTREFLTQSARGGTQTRGGLFGTGQDLVNRLQRRITETVNRYIAEMKPDEAHPFLGRRRGGFAYAGSWSSRLVDCGFHVNHVHPEGWISSCYYAGVPKAVEDETAKQGWIKFGEPGFEAGLAMRRAIRPAPGRLVLFPSYMWHGTIPFHDGQARTTIAFDAVPR